MSEEESKVKNLHESALDVLSEGKWEVELKRLPNQEAEVQRTQGSAKGRFEKGDILDDHEIDDLSDMSIKIKWVK